ncbi:MAG: M28 family peptidase [Candidatus Bathyarchaeia archaeon]
MKKALVYIGIGLLYLGLILSAVPGVESRKRAPYLSPEEQSFVNSINATYAYDLCERLSSFPYPYDGEVVPGSRQDYEVSLYLKKEMEQLGLQNVTIESFPVVNWNYTSASLEIVSPSEKRSIKTRSMACCPSTPNGDPIEAELVYVGLGRKQDYEKVVGGVNGKIVLIDRYDEPMWMTTPAVYEAAYHGAVAALIHNPFRDPEALNIDCAHNPIPTLSITGVDAAYLKDLLQKEKVKVKVAVDNDINEDAKAYIVYGYIWGSKYQDEYVIIEAHYDHWWCGAVDNNGGVASTLAIAKALLEARITPKRTWVFMLASGHESGTGGSKESYWDWALGAYYFMNVLHPEWAGKVVASLVTDGAGGVLWGVEWAMMIETTPELGGFLKKVAYDVRVSDLMTPYVFTPISSFDGWGFYMAGVPAVNVYYGPLLGAFESPYYHTDLATMDQISRDHLRMDAVFRGVAGLRLSQAEILPYELSEIGKEAREAVNKLLFKVPDAKVSALIKTLEEFENSAKEFQGRIKKLKNPNYSTVKEINAKMLECIKTVNPLLWDQDVGLEYPLPGWCSVSKFDTYTNDIPLLRSAIDALINGDAKTAVKKLEGVVTMDWGKHVSYPVYKDIVWLFNGTPYLNWAEGHLPWITDVHIEYNSIKAKMHQHEPNFLSEINSLGTKLITLYEKLNITTSDVQKAFNKGKMILINQN